MCQKKAVDSAVDLDELIQVSVPMSHVKTWGHGQGERNDVGSSCWSAAHSHEKEADQAKRNSAEPPTPAKAKAPPPLPQAGVAKGIPWDGRFEVEVLRHMVKIMNVVKTLNMVDKVWATS